jgi:hypothetical protein
MQRSQLLTPGQTALAAPLLAAEPRIDDRCG